MSKSVRLSPASPYDPNPPVTCQPLVAQLREEAKQWRKRACIGIVGGLAGTSGSIAVTVFSGSVLLGLNPIGIGLIGVAAVISVVVIGICYFKAKHRLRLIPYVEQDFDAIKKALIVTKQSHAAAFEKEHGYTFDSLVRALVTEMAHIHNSNEVACDGVKLSGKKWKYLVKMDGVGQIERLFIGLFKDKGSYTKVYCTPGHLAILVPKGKGPFRVPYVVASFFAKVAPCIFGKSFKKRKLKIRAEGDMRNSRKTIQKIRSHVADNPHLLKLQDREVLPPELVKMTTSKGRPIMLVAEAVSAKKLFQGPPKTKKELIERLKVLRDVALSINVNHKIGILHGDLKLDNMLVTVTENPRGQPTDYGGSREIVQSKSLEKAKEAFNTTTYTTKCNHANDLRAVHRLNSVKEVIHLGQARDLFALGVSTLQALIGLKKESKEVGGHRPFKPKAYKKFGEHEFLDGNAQDRKDIECINLIGRRSAERLNNLLDRVLDADYTKRGSLEQFIKDLDRIIRKV